MINFRNLLFCLLVLTGSCNYKYADSAINKASEKVIADTSASPVADSNFISIKKEIKENPYASVYDTSLKGGYSIRFRYDRKEQYLLFCQGNKIIDTIGDCSVGLIYKNLGYIAADFDSSFVFAQSFGSGNPHQIQLYEKASITNNLIPAGSCWIDADTVMQVLLFSTADVPSTSDSMNLMDVRKKSIKKYPYPKEVFGEPEILNRIHLVKLSNNSFTIEYEFNDRSKTKKQYYSR